MRISDWSSDVCSSDLRRQGVERAHIGAVGREGALGQRADLLAGLGGTLDDLVVDIGDVADISHVPQAIDVAQQAEKRSEERRVGKECVSTDSTRWGQYH